MKKCLRCGSCNNDFTKDSSKKDGLSTYCMVCSREKSRENQRSKFGLASRIYSNQKTNSKRRGHTNPDYSTRELREWLYSQPEYNRLYSEWVESEYDRLKAPSCDRINDSEGYSLSNIKLMTWAENKAKGHMDIRSMKISNRTLLNGGHCPIDKLSLAGDIIETYISQSEAARKNNVYQANIHKCLIGKIKTTGGFKWQYKKK